ncbi:MAG: ABC transporter substrate-binding protein [SAR324 cluster bacterium]|nr:ABC transporter substrate-binding protein [SAR324 cluster bacterium]
MKKFLLFLLVPFIALTSTAGGAQLSVAFGNVGKDLDVLKEFFAMFKEKTGHDVNVISMPSSTTDQFGQYKLWLSAKNKGIDIYMLDVIWAPQLASHFVDLSKPAAKLAKLHFPSTINSQKVNGKLVALPYFTDAPMLYYRKDLLTKYNRSVPKTWAEMAETASIIQSAERKAGNSKMWGYVFQGKAYEGLTCDALEWVNSFGGGQIVSPSGEITINNQNAIKALITVKSWVGNISPNGVLSYQEEESRGVWQTGNAVFMRNWPYAYNLSNGADSPVKGKFDVTPLPKGEGPNARSAATLGGWNVGVSKYSKNRDAAVELALFLASPEIQKLNAIKSSHYPTIPSLYEDKDVLEVAPFFSIVKDVLKTSVARPSAPTKRKYNEVSKLFWSASQSVISGKKSATSSLKELESRLKRLKGKGW